MDSIAINTDFHGTLFFQITYFVFIMIFKIATTTESTLNRDLVSVIYSPYTKPYDLSHLPPKTAPKDSYTLENVKEQLQIISSVFGSVVTLGMGVTYGNYNNPWNKTHSECLIASAAAEINKISNSMIISVLQGINIDGHEYELRNAFESTIFANSIHPNTVWGFLFRTKSEFDDSETSKLEESLKDFHTRKKLSELLNGLKIGISFFHNQCQKFLDNNQHNFINILKSVNFLICQSYPNPSDSSSTQKAQDVTTDFEFLKTGLKVLYANLEDILLESGWPTVGLNLNKTSFDQKEKLKAQEFINYWSSIQKWSNETRNRIIFYEAFDQPWACDAYRDPIPQCHMGLWSLSNSKSSGFAVKGDALLAYSFTSEPTPVASNESIWPIILGTAGIIFIITMFIMVICFYRIKASKNGELLSNNEVRNFLYGLEMQLDENNTAKHIDSCEDADYALVLPYDKSLELPKNNFSIDKSLVLGSGAFGVVYKGTVEGIPGPVAFKTVKTNQADELKDILSEIKVMTYIGNHPNVIRLLGAYTKQIRKGTVFISMEYCAKGSLQNYLRKHSVASDNVKIYVNEDNSCYANTMNIPGARYTYDPTCHYTPLGPEDISRTITVSDMIKWSHQISDAMEYLERKKVIHADLATRNVLLTRDFDTKVTDFGLSRRLYTYTNYVKSGQTPLPWRWMSIESLKHMTFSSKSDVWSYGVTMWEIFSLGDIPYPGLSWTPDFPNLLQEGLTLTKPKRANQSIYDLMIRCWRKDPQDRPSFQQIKEFFTKQSNYENIKT